MSPEPAPEGTGEEQDDDFDAGVGVGGDDEAGDGEQEEPPETGGDGHEDGSTLYDEVAEEVVVEDNDEDPLTPAVGDGEETGA